jgi:hypothetical protein
MAPSPFASRGIFRVHERYENADSRRRETAPFLRPPPLSPPRLRALLSFFFAAGCPSICRRRRPLLLLLLLSLPF